MTGGKTKKEKRDWNAFTYMPWYILYIDYMKRKRQDLETLVSQFSINILSINSIRTKVKYLKTLVSQPWEIQNYKHYQHYTLVPNSR